MSEFVRVASVSDLPAGQCMMVAANGKELALFNVDGKFYALDNSCPHRGGALGLGFMQGCVVLCPWHGWAFDVTTGASTISPSYDVEKYEVQIEGEEVLVKV